ncbi:hypothetical protein C2E21_5592 [Chlorella sorokiniana]|uniref:Uncharacterized protein n=1 Tax=Chlorella sorokiniana TaxID=3076 RepID=A0A2P6TNP2_CHLSO|nr:hypothetical protein C2E21_5592 [Chlorella sorokiniana]|eukprot:PRW50929.1 hypothetical protein C2E21_5592 [Chlorella sorokiniana]
MCHQFWCVKCRKKTWVGCGRHIDSALAGVSEEDRCHCKAWTQAQHDAEKGGGSCSLQ